MSLFVQVIEGRVVKVWDTPPPEGEADWYSAIEVKPDVLRLIDKFRRAHLRS
jgi:hypothetical protein